MAVDPITIELGLDNIFGSDYVQKNPTKAYKITYANEYVAVGSYLNGGPEPADFLSFSKMGRGLCLIEYQRRLMVTEEPEPTPVDTFKTFADFPLGPWENYFYLQRFQGSRWTGVNDTGINWSDGSGIFNPSPGVFRFVNKGMVPMGSGSGIQVANVWPGVLHLSGKILFPRSGNPDGFVTNTGDWLALFEWVDGSHTVFNQIGVDSTNPSAITIYCRTYNPSTGGTQKLKAAAPPNFYDVEHTFKYESKVSKGSDGYVRFWLNGQQVMNHSGPTVDASWNAKVWQQWGWYGNSINHKNEVIYSDLVKL